MGYSNGHAGDVYRFFDIASKRIKISRDVQWSVKFYVNREYVIIPNDNKNATIQITGDTGYSKGMTQMN